MREAEIETAQRFGIYEKIQKIESDLLGIQFVEDVEFDLSGFYDNMNQVIILTKYDIPVRSEAYFQNRRDLLCAVVAKAKEHGLARTADRIEDYGQHLYFVFYIADKELFYGS